MRIVVRGFHRSLRLVVVLILSIVGVLVAPTAQGRLVISPIPHLLIPITGQVVSRDPGPVLAGKAFLVGTFDFIGRLVGEVNLQPDGTFSFQQVDDRVEAIIEDESLCHEECFGGPGCPQVFLVCPLGVPVLDLDVFYSPPRVLPDSTGDSTGVHYFERVSVPLRCFTGPPFGLTCEPLAPVTVSVSSRFGNIEGTVKDASGRPVARGLVEASPVGGRPGGPFFHTFVGSFTTTDAAGFYQFPPFHPDTPMFGQGLGVPKGEPKDYDVTVSIFNADGVLIDQRTSRVAVRGGEISRADFVIGGSPEDRPTQIAQGPRNACAPETVGRPINVTTGNMYTQQEDLSYPSAFGRFAFTRTFNSQSTYQGPLGLGWTHPFTFELTELPSGAIWVRNGAGNVRFYELAAGSTDTYRVAAPGRDRSTLVKHASGFTETERDGLRREFDLQGQLQAIVSRAGWGTTLTYTTGRLATITDQGGRTLAFTYNTAGQLTRVEGPGALFAAYNYDPQGRLASVSDAQGVRWTYTYTDSSPSRLASVQDANGNLVEAHTYDTQGRVIATTGALGVGALALEYLGTSRTRVTDSLGRVTAYTFGVFGELPLITQIQGPCPCGTPDSTFEYDGQGRLIRQTDARGNSTTFEYDSAGNVTKRTDPLKQTTTWTYTTFGQILSTTDPTGATTTFEYDPATGFVLQITDALGNIAKLAPDPHNLPAAVTNPRGQTTTFVYGETGLPSAITDPTGATATFAYDPAGRLAQTTDPAGGKTLYAYDLRGRLLTVTDPVGTLTQLVSDPAGNRVGLTDPNGRSTAFAHDQANRLIEVTDPAGRKTSYTYDSENNLLSVTDARGNTTNFAYDGHNRLTQQTDSLSASEHFIYDSVGNLTARTDRKGQTITYAYDALNRLIEKTLPGGVSITYDYDAVGRLLKVNDANGTLAFTYDALGRVLTTTSQDERILTYSYDAAGNRVALQDETGSLTTYAYDPRDLLETISDPRTGVFRFDYDRLGRRIGLSRPNGTSTSYSYDSASRLTRLSHSGQRGPLETLSYTYDATGNRMADTRNGVAHQYTYDPLDQLTQVETRKRKPRSRGKMEEAYSYDPVGNRLTAPEGQRYQYDSANRLIQDSTQTYTHDANGNLIQKVRLKDGAITTYTYDAEDRLVRVVTPRAELAFVYDPLGRRIEKRVIGREDEDEDDDGEPDPEEQDPPRVTRYFYDQEDILATFNDSGHERARYTHGPGIDEPLAEARPHRTRYHHADALGSIVALTGKDGNPVRHYRYSAFGIPEDHRHDPQPYRFTGREWDKEIGLYYYRARHYTPLLGRFLQEDLIELVEGQTNRYPYVDNNPVTYVDPTGLIKGIHFDYGRSGERLIHYGKYRFNQLGQLVKHTGEIIGEATGKAKRALEFLKTKKPDFFLRGPLILFINPCVVDPTAFPELCGPICAGPA